jgi:hypothetical protein
MTQSSFLNDSSSKDSDGEQALDFDQFFGRSRENSTTWLHVTSEGDGQADRRGRGILAG